MKVMNTIMNIVHRIIDNLFFGFLVIVFALGIYTVYDIYQIYNSFKIDNDILNIIKTKDNSTMKKLNKINKEIIGWINIEDTSINYPLLQSKNNTKYSSRNYKQKFSVAGSIFLDFRNDKNMNDDFIVIYGHYIEPFDNMFSDIHKYRDKEYFDTHTNGSLYIMGKSYDMRLYAYAKTDVIDNNIYNVNHYKSGKNKEIIESFKNIATYINDIDISDTDKLVMLSTCENDVSTERNVLLFKIDNQ